MSVEGLIFTTLRTLVSDRVYPDLAPQDVTALPRITYQQVGGQAVNFLEAALPDKRNGRFQVNVWAATRLQASSLARQAAAALKTEAALNTTILGELVAVYEPDTRLYGTLQDFSFWTA